MRIYEGTPRQEWEDVMRSLGAFVDREGLKEILLLELADRFILQGLILPMGGARSGMEGSLQKRTHEFDDARVADLIEERAAARGTGTGQRPRADPTNYYEQAFRVLGNYVDQQRARDLFFFEQGGSFVIRLLPPTAAGGTGHLLAEFTRDEIVAMIDAAAGYRTPGTDQ